MAQSKPCQAGLRNTSVMHPEHFLDAKLISAVRKQPASF
jgi:hypothetical protein